MIAQRDALVLAAEQSAPLKLRHHPIDEIVEALRDGGDHDLKPSLARVSSHSSIPSAIDCGVPTKASPL